MVRFRRLRVLSGEAEDEHYSPLSNYLNIDSTRRKLLLRENGELTSLLDLVSDAFRWLSIDRDMNLQLRRSVYSVYFNTLLENHSIDTESIKVNLTSD